MRLLRLSADNHDLRPLMSAEQGGCSSCIASRVGSTVIENASAHILDTVLNIAITNMSRDCFLGRLSCESGRKATYYRLFMKQLLIRCPSAYFSPFKYLRIFFRAQS